MSELDATSTPLSLDQVTRDMRLTHRVLRYHLPRASELVRGVTPDAAGRTTAVARHLRLVLSMLQAHHEAEDACVWPLLFARAPEHTALLETMETQHGQVAGRVAAVDDALHRWERTPDNTHTKRLADALDAVTSVFAEHADLEEASALPVIAEHLSPAEWRSFVRYSHGAVPDADRLVVLGLIMDPMAADERAAFLQTLPPPVAARWASTGQGQYAAYTAAVRG